jgi:CubicO group peptidase (beta-lactamase class C family)
MKFPVPPMRLGQRARPHDPALVTHTDGGQTEVDPREVGISRADVDAIWNEVIAVYRTGIYPGMSLCLRRHGKVLLDRAIGHAHGNGPGDSPGTPLIPATPRTLFCLFSASKMVTAMLVHLLDDRGLLHIDDPVARFLPAFREHDKQRMTIRHVLTHRAGIPSIPDSAGNLDLLLDPQGIIERLRTQRPVWRPGRRLAYHALTGGFVLGEVIRVVTGKDVRELQAEAVCKPLGLRHMNYGVPRADIPQVAVNVRTGLPVLPPFSTLFERALGVDFEAAVRKSNDPRFLTGLVPAGNVYCTADEACRYMEVLRRGGELDGVRVFGRRTVGRAVAEQSYHELDLTMGLPVRYGMGFILGSRYLSLYGGDTTRAFGHLGFTNVVLSADPERGTSLAFLQNGKVFLSTHLRAWYRVLSTISQRIPRDAAAVDLW